MGKKKKKLAGASFFGTAKHGRKIYRRGHGATQTYADVGRGAGKTEMLSKALRLMLPFVSFLFGNSFWKLA